MQGLAGSYLSDKEIDAVLARRDLIPAEVERMVERNYGGKS